MALPSSSLGRPANLGDYAGKSQRSTISVCILPTEDFQLGDAVRRFTAICNASTVLPLHGMIRGINWETHRVDSRPIGVCDRLIALVKHILNRHRGRLAIHSTPGAGANFIVRLPLSAVADSELNSGEDSSS